MEKNHNRTWMVRAGERGYLIDDFLNEEFIAIGWNDLGKLDLEMTYEQLKKYFRETYPEDSNGRVNQCVGQIWRFLHEFKIGDNVVSYDTSGREYYVGNITSDYIYDDTQKYFHIRKVSWNEGGIYRDILSSNTKNTLGAISTIFELSNEILGELHKSHPGYISEDELESMKEASKFFEEQNLQDIKDNTISRSQEFIKDSISNLSWQETEILVAGILKSMGYRTRMTSKGGDLGSDIIASPDELGLSEPRIKVEVKKRSKDKIGADEIRNFIGGMRGHHKGIFVTTTGFSKEAIYEAERANFAITLVDSNWLVELLISNYEALEPEIKALVPLKKIYWPV